VCFGGGTCKVLSGSAPATVLDTLSDSGSIANPGDTRAIANNNTLHVLVSDAGAGGNQSNVVEYQILGEDANGNPVPHGVATVLNSTGVGGIQAIALNNAGHMFILNANGSNPQIVELNQSGTSVATTQLDTNCSVAQVTSMDLSAVGSSAYVTSGGTIQRLTFPTTCAAFANLGSGVTFYGIRDIPPLALPANCNSAPCPATEAVLVIANGFFDSNGDGLANGSDTNICTDTIGGTAVSCALLLKTDGSADGLTAQPWKASFVYAVGQRVLDAHLHVQQVTAVSANAKSGNTTPTWNDNPGGFTTDNKVTWQEQGTSVGARYVGTGQTTLRALALDPLIGPCVTSPCSPPTRKVSNFWMADSASGSFLKLNFASAVATSFSTSIPSCTGCSGIQSIGIYGAEHAAQPGLSQFADQTLTIPALLTSSNTVSYDFKPGSADDNKVKMTAYASTATNSARSIPLAVYASSIAAASGTSDSGLPCLPTTENGNCVVWEQDNPPPPSGVESAQNFTFAIPTGIDFNNVDVLQDEQLDITFIVGNQDPVPRKFGSCLLSLHTITPAVQGASNCQYGSPLTNSPPDVPACFSNGNNIKFNFQCSSTGATPPSQLQPLLRVVRTSVATGAAPDPLFPLQGTGGTANYRGTNGNFSFNLLSPGNGTYAACTFEGTHSVETFCTNFVVKNKCP